MIKKTFICIITLYVAVFSQTFDAVYVPGPDMNVARMGHQSVMLSDSSVLLIGGHGIGFTSLNTAERFIPQPDSFVLFTMNYAHDQGAVCLMSDSNIFIAGGAADLGVAPGYKTVEIFNRSTNTFQPYSEMQYSRCNVNAVQMADGNIFICGGWYDQNSGLYTEVYFPANQTSVLTNQLNVSRSSPLLIPAADSQVIVFSGYPIYGGEYYTSVEYYNPVTKSFTFARSTLFANEDEAGWIPYPYNFYLTMIQDLQLENGKYIFLARKKVSNDSTIYGLFTVDPVTKEFQKVALAGKLPSSKEYNPLSLVVDKSQHIVYIPTQNVNATTVEISLFAVELTSGKVLKSATSYTFPSEYYIYGANYRLMKDGRILMSGGHTQTGYYTNFSPHKKTLFITPLYSPTVVEEYKKMLPSGFELYPAYPNPFNPTTTIQFSIPQAGNVKLVLYDVLGREIQTVANNFYTQGLHQVTINGKELQSGVLYCRMFYNQQSGVQKLLLLK